MRTYRRINVLLLFLELCGREKKPLSATGIRTPDIVALSPSRLYIGYYEGYS
jgi:hypothetical protein